MSDEVVIILGMGDGETDATEFVRAYAAQGRPLPAGRYRITRPVEMGPDSILRGPDAASTGEGE